MVKIKMKMPKTCLECPFIGDGTRCCVTGQRFKAKDSEWIDKKRSGNCPIVGEEDAT